jgi:hypothetical protein
MPIFAEKIKSDFFALFNKCCHTQNKTCLMMESGPPLFPIKPETFHREIFRIKRQIGQSQADNYLSIQGTLLICVIGT